MLSTATARPLGALLQRQGLRGLAAAASSPQIMKADVSAYGEGVTTLVSKGEFRFVVDEPPKLGGKGLGPNPLSLLLGSLVGCTQYTSTMIAKEMQLGDMGAVAWTATGEYDLRGVRGGEPGVDARFRRVRLEGTADGPLSQADLDRIAEQVDRRCIVAATLKASGMDLSLRLAKGTVDHECEPACALHNLQAAGPGSTGQVKGGRPSREADSPQFQGQRAAARGYASLARRGLHSAARPLLAKDGEDVAREHMGAHAAPQLQRDTSEAGAPTTAGGAYASRDDPAAQAAQPTAGKSGEQIIQEQGAGATVHPQATAEGGQPMEPEQTQPVKRGQGVDYEPAHSPRYAGSRAAAEEEADQALEEEMGKDVDATDYKPWEE